MARNYGSGGVYQTLKSGTIWVNKEGTWFDIQGLSGVDGSRADASSEVMETLSITLQQTGIPQVPQISYPVTYYTETDPVWKYLKDQFIAHNDVEMAITTRERQLRDPGLVAANSIAIATSGVVTFGGNGLPDTKRIYAGKQYYRGMSFKVGTKYYIVQDWVVDDTTGFDATKVNVIDAATGLVPSSAVVASAYKVVMMPIIIGPFACTISNIGIPSGGVSGAISSPFMVNPIAELPDARLFVGPTP